MPKGTHALQWPQDSAPDSALPTFLGLSAKTLQHNASNMCSIAQWLCACSSEEVIMTIRHNCGICAVRKQHNATTPFMCLSCCTSQYQRPSSLNKATVVLHVDICLCLQHASMMYGRFLQHPRNFDRSSIPGTLTAQVSPNCTPRQPCTNGYAVSCMLVSPAIVHDNCEVPLCHVDNT